MANFLFFWNTMKRCDWRYEPNDLAVLSPVISSLAGMDDAKIFEFHDIMSELLYQLDIKRLYLQCQMVDPSVNPDTYLYSRCAALINGPDFFKQVMLGRGKTIWEREYRSVLLIPERAWNLKHPQVPYVHRGKFSVTTGSNQKGWT